MAWFDASSWPRISVLAGIGTTPGGTVCILGSGVLDTNVLGGANMVEVGTTTAGGGPGNIRSLSIREFGRPSEIDAATPTACTITLNNSSGDYDPTNLSGQYVSGGVSLVEVGAPVEVRAEYPAGMFWPLFTGEIADIATDAGLDPTVTFTCADGLENLGRAYLPLEIAPVFAGDLTGRRVGNLADRAGWPFDKRALDDGNNVLGGTLLGSSALDLMQQVERTEFGLLFVDQAGVLTFFDRYRTQTANRSVVVQVAFVDTAGGPSVTDLELARSRERVYNRAAITRNPRAEDPDEEPVEQVANDLAAQADPRYGVLAFPAQVGDLLQSDTEVLAMAQGLVGRFATPQHRIREVRVDPLNPTYVNHWPKLLGLRPLDRISVTHDYGPNTPTAELLVQQLDLEVNSDPPTWDLRLTTSPAPAVITDTCILDAGLLGTHKLGW